MSALDASALIPSGILKIKAISEFPNNRIAYNIKPVLGLHRF